MTDTVPERLLCQRCEYSLAGLFTDGACPECGLPVEQSIRTNFRLRSDTVYLRRLSKGLSLLLNGILAMLVLVIGSIVMSFAIQSGSGYSGQVFTGSWYIVQFATQALTLCVVLVVLWGFWLFASPDSIADGDEQSAYQPADPDLVGLHDPMSRRVLRIATVSYAIISVITTVFGMITSIMLAQWATQSQSASGGQASPFNAIPSWFIVFSIVNMVLGLLSYGAMGTMFFSSMLYLRGLALRIPDLKIHRKAKSRMISCPIWSTVGLLIIIGPFIALVLYWNLLNSFLQQIKVILRARDRGAEGPVFG